MAKCSNSLPVPFPSLSFSFLYFRFFLVNDTGTPLTTSSLAFPRPFFFSHPFPAMANSAVQLVLLPSLLLFLLCLIIDPSSSIGTGLGPRKRKIPWLVYRNCLFQKA